VYAYDYGLESATPASPKAKDSSVAAACAENQLSAEEAPQRRHGLAIAPVLSDLDVNAMQADARWSLAKEARAARIAMSDIISDFDLLAWSMREDLGIPLLPTREAENVRKSSGMAARVEDDEVVRGVHAAFRDWLSSNLREIGSSLAALQLLSLAHMEPDVCPIIALAPMQPYAHSDERMYEDRAAAQAWKFITCYQSARVCRDFFKTSIEAQVLLAAVIDIEASLGLEQADWEQLDDGSLSPL
jgi:hypothetical protein